MALLAACAVPLALAAPHAHGAADAAASSGVHAGLAATEVQRRMQDAGYADVHDVEYDDGRWEADATAASGARVELSLDADGRVVLDPDDD